MWELIEPLDEDGTYARFLAEKGEGINPSAGRRVLGSLARRCPALELRGALVGLTAQNSTPKIYLSVDASRPGLAMLSSRQTDGRRIEMGKLIATTQATVDGIIDPVGE